VGGFRRFSHKPRSTVGNGGPANSRSKRSFGDKQCSNLLVVNCGNINQSLLVHEGNFCASILRDFSFVQIRNFGSYLTHFRLF